MNQQRANELIRKYNLGLLEPAEETELELALENGLIQLEALEDLRELDQRLDAYFAEERSRQMRNAFDSLLVKEKEALRAPAGGTRLFDWLRQWIPSPGFSVAYGLLFLLLGGIGGYILRGGARPVSDPQIAQLSEELRDMRETMMMSLLEQESTADRLKAVNLTQEMGEANGRVISALLRTLNEDPNTNVRLAALEALSSYSSSPQVREGLIESIRNQDSPLVQLAFAEVMTALQEKRSVKDLRELLEREETAPEVKEKIQAAIEVLM